MKQTVKHILRALLLVAVAAAMGSCVLGRKYQSPEFNLPDRLSDSAPDNDSLLFADMRWWEVYSDTTLRNLISATLANNKDMRIAAERVQELAQLRRIDNAAMLPQIGGTAYGEREWENYGGNNPDVSPEFGAKLTLGWELDLWGNLRWARRKGVAEYLESVEAQRALQMTLIAEVAQAYYELAALDNELAIVRRTLATRQEGVRQAKIRFEGGLTSETSYQQSQVELASTATLVPELERKVAAKENEIALLAGRYPGPVERSSLDNAMKLPQELPVGLPSELLLRRPDVRAAEQALIAANAAVGMAYTDRFPRIRLTGAYGLEGDAIQSILQSPYGLLSGTLTTPIFSFNAKRAKYRAQQHAYEQECARYEKKVLTVFQEVNDAIVGYNSAREACVLKRNLEQASRKYVELARLQYINGVINYLDVLDAQRQYFDAQIGLSNAIRDEYIALVQLYKALGGGWDTTPPPTEEQEEQREEQGTRPEVSEPR